ncbi:hypothetical protein BYT27DRAFT_7162151 [Phlegmacium glaucopus]|nr:hypothetical protein BYT27DRAFT_7162151 [Phlegmacium glaucopus]
MEAKVQGNLPPWQQQQRPRLQIRRVFSYIALFSIVVTLFMLLPTQWSIQSLTGTSKVAFNASSVDPADEWQDNVYPLRAQTPWDISTDYSYPRTLEYDVQEGTWLRLDVHPTSGDVVFDMVGDLYCLPGSHALQPRSTGPIKALPILLGIPHDSEPHFSPSGDRLLFRSDAELGVENIWVMEWKGCEQMNVRTLDGSTEDLRAALLQQAVEEKLLAQGVAEDPHRKANRLIREGRLHVQRVTNETFRWFSEARFHPSGTKVIATKRYTSSRSLGAGEGWEYSVPSVSALREGLTSTVKEGSGIRRVSRSLPQGWTSQEYGDQQIGPEQLIWNGDDSIIYSLDVMDASEFTYSKDVHKGIYAIFERNITSGTTKTLVDASPGGANRPELSRDRRTLAFVRRVRDKEALVLKDLKTGTIHNVWHGLTYDLSAVAAPMGTYPSFAFTPDDSGIIIWAAGQIYFVPLTVNQRGEKLASLTPPHPIRFTAHIEKRLAETRRGGTDVVGVETRDTQKVSSFKELRVDEKGHKAVFQAAGVTYWQKVGKKIPTKVPVIENDAPYYSPTFVHGEDQLVLHARWSDSDFTTFELADIKAGMAYEIQGLPLGRYFSPTICECNGSKRQIAFLKSSGTVLSGDVVATAREGLYVGDIVLPSSGSVEIQNVTITNLRFVPSEIDTNDRQAHIRFLDGNKKLLVHQGSRAFTIDLKAGPDNLGLYTHKTLASGKMCTELVVSPKQEGKSIAAKTIAFVEVFDVYITSGKNVKDNEMVWSKPGNATNGLIRLSLDGGHDITWTGDGKKIFWFLGPYLHSLEISKLTQCSSQIKHDQNTFGISCVKNLVEYQQIDIEHSTDIARLKKEAEHVSHITSNNFDLVVITNATLLTMESGNPEADLIRNGVLTIRAGVIESVGAFLNYTPPTGATVIDAEGGYIIPGFIDVHAHWSGFSDRFPAKSWEMQTFLAYGITTLHNPSAHNVDSFCERSRIESGLMIGPRIFSVGDIIYGAALDVHQEIVNMDEAVSALTRIKVEGGPGSISYKNYNIPSRASRQRLLKVAQNISMLCVPEGGMNYDWDLTYIIDGMTTVEHAIPVPTLYDDVITLYALSGTGSTPTHIVNYGGAWGEQLVWATQDIPNDPKLRRFTRHDTLETLSESTSRPMTSYALFNTSSSVAAMVHKGLLANIGAHGEPPLGVNYHAEMGFTAKGGLNNYEVIQAATASGAKTLGMFPSLGSLSPGKLADFIVYPPGVDLLEGDVSQKTLELKLVVRGGRIWEAETMVEVWPVKGRKQSMPAFNAE